MINTPVVLILASGKATRFRASGASMNKLAAPLDGIPVLQHTLRAVQASGLAWKLVDGVVGGMGDTIARGVALTQTASGWLILPGDLPLIKPDSLQRVANALASYPVVVPVWNTTSGHPVGFSGECMTELMALTGDKGASSIVRAYRQVQRVYDLVLDDRGIVDDIDTLDDLFRIEQSLHAPTR